MHSKQVGLLTMILLVVIAIAEGSRGDMVYTFMGTAGALYGCQTDFVHLFTVAGSAGITRPKGGSGSIESIHLTKPQGSTTPAYASIPTSKHIMHATAPSTTFYVNSLTGSDSNNGTSPATPWLTLGKAENYTFPASSRLLIYSRSVFHKQLTVPANLIYIGAYGPQRNCTLTFDLIASCTSMPVIDGSDVVTGWIPDPSHPGVYQAPYVATASKAFVDALYGQTVPLALQSNVHSVSANGGVYSDGTNVYVQLPDGTSPTTHTIEVAGNRKYGIYMNGQSGVTIDGLEVIRVAKSGYLNYGSGATGTSNTIQNSVLFNVGDSLPDTALGGLIEGAILSLGYFRQAPVSGFSVRSNWVGRMDFPHNTLNYTLGGIQVMGMADAQISGNKVVTVNGWAIRAQDFFNNNCTSPIITGNETVNSEGNIVIGGCVNAIVEFNRMHDSFGNAIEAGPGFQPKNLSTGLYLGFNEIRHLRSAYSNRLYNGIDINYVADGIAVGNHCENVAASCMTLEADTAPSSGWTIVGNTFDASNNVYGDGTAPNRVKRVYPFYVRDLSIRGLTQINNILIGNAASGNVMKYGSTSAGDQTHDVALPVFFNVCPFK